MDIVKIQCPNCGAPIERKQGAYFGKCPFCGVEIGFDEMKEEVQFGDMQNRINVLENQNQIVLAHRKALDKWLKGRTIMFIAVFITSFIGFMLVGTHEDKTGTEEFITGIGVISMILSFFTLFIGPIVAASVFPGYRSPNMPQVPKENSKVRMWLKLMAIGLLIALAGAFTAYLIASFFGLER